MTKKTKAMETPGYLDIAFDFGVEIMESGLIDPALYQKLSDPKVRGKVIPAIVQTIRREFSLEPVLEPVATSDSDDNLDPLPSNHHRVYVGYDMPRKKAKLEAEFSKNGVSELFYGNHEWQPHPSCAKIDQTPGNRVMLVKCFNRAIESENAIAEMDKLGYRPATHLEAYAFAKANPKLQRQFWIVALGSSTMHDSGRYVAVFGAGGSRSWLHDFRFDDGEWGAVFRFLFVRKTGC